MYIVGAVEIVLVSMGRMYFKTANIHWYGMYPHFRLV